MKTINLFVVVLVFAGNLFAADPLTERLQRGLFEEEANHNLDAAIKEYQSAVAQSDEQRKVVATALFRLGECYRKLGRTNDAHAFYQRILRDFAEQEPLVRLANELVKPAAGVAGPQPELIRELRSRVTALRFESIAQEVEADRLARMPREALMNTVAATNSPSLITLQQQQQAVVQRLTLLRNQFSDQHPEVVAQNALLKRIEEQLGQVLQGIPLAARERADALAAQLKALGEELKKAEVAVSSSPFATPPVDPAVVNLLREEIRLAEQVVQTNERKMKAGRGSLDELLEAKKDVLRLKRQLPEHWPPAQQRVLLDEQIGLVKQLLADFEKRIQAGLLPQGGQIPIQRELLSLQRELAVVGDVAKGFGETPPSSATALTQVEAEELARVKTLARNSPDLLQSPSGPWGGPLPDAAVAGHYSVVEFLLSLGLSPNGAERGRAPLLIAAGAGHLRIVQLLLDKGADVNAVDPTQETALMYAAFNGRRTVVELLLERGADVNRANNDGITALHKVAFKGYSSLAELLLKRGCKPDVLSRNQRGLLYDGVAWPSFTQYGTTPLHLAVERQFTPLVELLLKQGASARVTNYNWVTPLHLATASDNTNISALLLAQGASSNAEDSKGNTPFSQAIEHRQSGTVALMLAKGAEVNRPLSIRLEPQSARSLGRQFDVVYPLHIAVSRNSGPALDVLLKAKPDLEVTNSVGQTPLLAAVMQGNMEMAESLLEAGADPNHKTEQWGTPVLQAVGRASPQAVEALLKHGANPNVFNNSGDTPLSLAQEALRTTPQPRPAFVQIEQLLREHGASENLRRLFAIDYTRPSWTAPGPKMFHRGTNDYNRHTLFEFLVAVFSENRRPVFPDLAHVTIERLEGTNAKPKQIMLNIESLLLATNCSNNLWMEWGDRVSFPELDHPLNSGWPGFSQPTRDLLSRCLERHVQIVVKQATNTVKLVQNMDEFRTIRDAGDDADSAFLFNSGTFNVTFNNVGGVAIPAPPPPEKVLATFRLKEVVSGANVLRASSDPTRVRVSRLDPVTHKAQIWVIDLTKVATSSEWGNNSERSGKLWNLHDLWLRDGDVIEVPEKP